MSRTVVGQGNHGGISLLDKEKPRDPDEAEKQEQWRVRSVDSMYSVLTEVFGPQLGPGVLDYQVVISKPGLRDQDMTFDRLYRGPLTKNAAGDTVRGTGAINLLVHNFSTRKGIDFARAHAADENVLDDEMRLDIEMRSQYAKDNGYLFLPVIDGKVEREDIARLQVLIKERLAKAA